MKAVVQRVNKAALYCEGALVSEIADGLVVYFGVACGDDEKKADYLAKKIANLRIFADDAGKMNLSALDLNRSILVVSQFTLLADVSHGNRPSFTNAELPDIADALYEYFCNGLAAYGLTVKTGVFGGDMTIDQQNCGPVTIIYEV